MHPLYQDLLDRFHELHNGIIQLLGSLPDEALDWKPGAEMNSLSALVTHLSGAERFLVGDIVMGEPSNRDREAEFSAGGISQADLVKRLTSTEAYLESAFEKLIPDDLQAFRIHPRNGKQVGVGWAILHALEHTGIHTGHIELTVQLWQQKNAG